MGSVNRSIERETTMNINSNLDNEATSLVEFCDGVQQVLKDKGYYHPECAVWIEPSDAYQAIRINIEYRDMEGEDRKNKWYHADKDNVFSTAVAKVIEFLEELDDADLAYRRHLMSKLDKITEEMDSAGFEGAKAIIEAILEPMRSNLLEDKR
jgi:DNA-dependent RNA polymerase auxiliary subunit epsilon